MKKTIHILLWSLQVVLAITLFWAAFAKIFLPTEQLEFMWPWTGDVSRSFVLVTGTIDFLGAIGLILPSLFRFKPVLTPIAAIGVVLLMISAAAFHISRGEVSQIGFNVVFGLLAAALAYGRLKIIPVK